MDEMTENYNSICIGSQRTITQLKNQWMSTKIAAKKKVSERRKEILKTGGGSLAAKEPISSDDITVWLPNEFYVDSNEFDSDAALIEIVQDTAISVENNDTVQSSDATEKEFIQTFQETVPNSTPLLKKKIPKKSNAEHNIYNMVELDMKCREELHKRQLEVESVKLDVEKAKLEVEKARLEVEKAKIRNLNGEYGKSCLYSKYSVGTYACV